jgi:hypothetical protein
MARGRRPPSLHKGENVKKTNEEVMIFANVAGQLLSRDSKEHQKFRYALNRMLAKTKTQRAAYEEAAEDINVEHCATGENGVLIIDANGRYCYDREGKKNQIAELRALNKREVEIEPHYVDEENVPKDLDERVRDVLTGFVLKDEGPSQVSIEIDAYHGAPGAQAS